MLIVDNYEDKVLLKTLIEIAVDSKYNEDTFIGISYFNDRVDEILCIDMDSGEILREFTINERESVSHDVVVEDYIETILNECCGKPISRELCEEILVSMMAEYVDGVTIKFKNSNFILEEK